jgi:hypothetical protein
MTERSSERPGSDRFVMDYPAISIGKGDRAPERIAS